MRRLAIALTLGVLAIAGCGRTPDQPPAQAAAAIAAVERDATGWPSYGGQSSGTKYSALDQINRANVGSL